ncbi:MAG: metallophosphoesterase, partial [Endomicrobia bacterium]|nr:metallophosphoesterase [Endomicrobiia bacterium]
MRTYSKLISIFITVCFVITNAFAQNFAYAPNIAQNFNINDTSLIPQNLGRITEVNLKDSAKTLIFIQDVHANFQVQENIYKILNILNSKFKIEKVILEGAPYGKINTAALSALPEKISQSIKDNLMQTGYLSGAEMFVSQNEQTSQTAYGIENWDVYLANIYRASDILNDYFSNKSVINAFQSKVFLQTSRSLKGKASKLNSVIINKNFSYNKINDLSKIFNKPLPSIDIQNHVLQNRVHNNINYKNVEKQMSAYLESLKNILPYKNYKAIIDKQFDKAEFYKELYFSAKSTDLSAFVKNYPDLNLFLVSFINSEKTNPLNSYVETENYLNSLISDRTLSKTERELLTLSKMTALLDNFFGLELTPEDYRYFIENLNFYKNFLKTYYPKNKINALLNNEQIIDYYEANISRDGIFLENISSYIKASGGTNIFVSGGFHTEMLKDLNDKDISYIVITPNITQTGSNYKLRISQQGRVSQHDKNALAPIPLLLAPDSSVNEYIRNEYFSSLIGNIIKASDSKNPEALRSIINNWLKDVEEKLQSEGKDFDKLEVSFTKDTFTIKGKTQSITFPIKSGKIVFEDSSLIRTLIAKAGSIFNTSMMVVNNSLGHFLKNEIKFIENNSNISVPVVIIGKKTEITIDESLAKALIQVKEKEGLTKEHEKQLQTAITNIITEAIRNSQSFFPENANPAGNLADEIKITIASKSKHLFSYDKESKTIIVNEIVLKALEMFPKNISALLNACLTHEFIHAVTDIPEKDLEAFEQEQVLRDIENMKNLVGDEEEGKHFTLMMLYIADLSSLIFGNILNAPANENEFMDKILEGSLSITEIRHYAKKFFEYGKTAESVEKEIAFFENLTYKTAPDKPLYNKYLDTIKDKHNENKAKLEKFQKDFETAASKKNQRFAFGMTAGFLKSEVEEALEKLYDSIPTELFEAYYTGSNHYSFTHTVEVLNGIIKLFEMDSKIFSDMKDDEMKALAYAVVMHDISTFIVQDNHERNSSIWAGAILKNLSKDLPKGFSDLVQKICMGHRKIKEDFQPREEHKGYQAARILHDADAIAILENMEIIFDIWNQENTRGMIFDGSKSIAERVNMLKDNLYKGTESGDYINDIVRHFVYRKNEGLFLTEAGKNYIHNNPGGRRALLRFLFGLKEGEEDRESLHDFLNNNNYEKDENSLVEKIKNSGNKVFIPGKPQGTAVTNEDIEVIFDTIEKVIYSLRNIAPTDENVYNPYLNKQSEQTPKAYLEDLISNDRKNEKSLILSDLHGSGDRTLLLLEEVLSYPNSNEPNEKGEKKPAIQISDLANIIKNSDIDKVYVLGDVVDRGEQQADTVKIVEAIMASGKGAYVLGNHDINVLMNLSRMHIPYYDGYKGVIGYETRDAKGDALMNLEEYRKFLVGVATLVKNIHSNINKLEEKYLNTEDPGKKSKIIDDIIKQLTLARNYQFHVDSFMAKAFENKKATAKNLIKRFEREAKSIKIDDSQDSVRIEHKMDLEDKESKELINQLGMRVIEEKGS